MLCSNERKRACNMDDLKLIVASNLIRLRTAKGLTQAELGTMLNYSDKTVSKWERADALPDAAVLKKIGEIYGVSVDYLLSSHNAWQKPTDEEELPPVEYSRSMIVLVSIISIWTLAILLFVIFWVLGAKFWVIFVSAIPISLVTLLTLNSVFYRGKRNEFIIYALVLSVFLLIYFALFRFNPWQLFLVLVPAELVVFLSFRIKKHSKKLQK